MNRRNEKVRLTADFFNKLGCGLIIAAIVLPQFQYHPGEWVYLTALAAAGCGALGVGYWTIGRIR